MKQLLILFLSLTFVGCAAPSKFKLIRRPVVQQETVAWPTIGEWPRQDVSQTEHALIVGVPDYAFLPDIDGVGETVNDWEKYFTSRGASVELVYDRDATKEKILEHLKDRPNADLFWFVFVGHGAPSEDGSDGVLVGMDAQQNFNSIKARGVPRSEIINALGSQRSVLILDTCFSGRDSNGELLAEGTQPVVPVFKEEPAPEVTVLTASDADQFSGSFPNLNRPAFSYLMLGALKGWTGDANITAKGAVAYATTLLREAPGRVQTPTISGNDIAFGPAIEPAKDLLPVLRANKESRVEGPTERVFIDTGEGLIFERPDPRWVMPGYVMSSAFYPKTVIHFRWGYRMLIVQRDGTLGRTGVGTNVEFSVEPEPRNIGRLSGNYAEWTKRYDGESNTQHHVGFVIKNGNGIWRVTGIASDKESMSDVRADVIALVSSIEFP